MAEAIAAEERRQVQTDAAAAEAGGTAVAETAAAGERRQAQADAAAREAHGEAVAEPAAEVKRVKKAEAGRRKRVEFEEAAMRRSGGHGPIMHGISY